MRKIAIIAPLLISTLMSKAQRTATTTTDIGMNSTVGWTCASISEDHLEVYYVSDAKPTISELGYTQQWVKIFSSSNVIKGVRYRNTVTLELFEVDCSRNRYKYRAIIDYSSKGEVLEMYNYDEYDLDFYNAVPSSIANSILKSICSSIGN